MKAFFDDWKILVLLCLTLGLAPFSPEPHLWGKLSWLAGGGEGMALQDYGDLLMHGAPFVLLIIYGVRRLRTSPQSHS